MTLLLWLVLWVSVPPDPFCNVVTITDDRAWSIDLRPVPWRTGRMLWASTPITATIDGAPIAVGPQRAYTLRGPEDVVITQGAPPYDVALCWPGDLLPWAGYRVALPGITR